MGDELDEIDDLDASTETQKVNAFMLFLLSVSMLTTRVC